LVFSATVDLAGIYHDDAKTEVRERGLDLGRSVGLINCCRPCPAQPFLVSGIVKIYDQDFHSLLDMYVFTIGASSSTRAWVGLPTGCDNKVRELETVCFPWQQPTESAVRFDDIGISAFTEKDARES
jgi:hypothetical protein